jgi:hypothetical protein
MSPLGELSVRWTGSDDLDVEADVHIDEFEACPEPLRDALVLRTHPPNAVPHRPRGRGDAVSDVLEVGSPSCARR